MQKKKRLADRRETLYILEFHGSPAFYVKALA